MKACIFSIILCLLPLSTKAQGNDVRITGGLDTRTLWSVDGTLYSNNYLKLDYINGRFSAGMQAEYYPNPLPGYNSGYKGFGLPGKYISWQDKLWGVTAGDFYEQFGTGVLFRSWEDRDLGWNNSVGGARLTFRTKNNFFSMKMIYGWPRHHLWYGTEQLAGTEATIVWNNIRFQGGALIHGSGETFSAGYSALLSYDINGFGFKTEWVGHMESNAQTVELGYSKGKWSVTMTGRRLYKMTDRLGLNYLPSLSMEQSYALASMSPYTTFSEGEIGGSADFYCKLKSWRFHVNCSMIYTLPNALTNYDVCRMGYRDLNIQVEKRWNRNIKVISFISIQEQSPSHGDRIATEAQNVFVLDGQFRITGDLTIRTCAQYLYSQELTRDWMAYLLEISSTSGWSVHLQDIYNHGSTKENYYEVGAGWTKDGLKINLSYGRQRAGFVCSGGICRWQPEYKGGLLHIYYLF